MNIHTNESQNTTLSSNKEVQYHCVIPMRRVSENRDNGNRTDDMSMGGNDLVMTVEAISTLRSLENLAPNDTRRPAFDPLRILVPMTDTCLILYAIVVILSMAMIALVVILAVIKKYFPWSDLQKYYEM